jgi:hypothetical protein
MIQAIKTFLQVVIYLITGTSLQPFQRAKMIPIPQEIPNEPKIK